ncbi:hypothetical protein ACIBTZ_24520 [Micromonospora sp. NPDC049460]|uniref:hypothetical protein n=1 Tax=unclassified Micromonospora TaxID=2617518 RepID=UPI0033E62FD7
MTSFPGSPRTLHGAVVAVDLGAPATRPIVFQYNPDQVTRTVRPRGGPDSPSAGPADPHRLSGAPVETISLTLEVDAADQLANGDEVAAAMGVMPHLAALELLLYPPSSRMIENAALLLTGAIEILPAQGPLTLLVWGPGRALPVRIEGISIVEQAFDPELFPTRASVDLSARVLSYHDLPVTDPGYALFLVHQVAKELMAGVGRTGAAAASSGLPGA